MGAQERGCGGAGAWLWDAGRSGGMEAVVGMKKEFKKRYSIR